MIGRVWVERRESEREVPETRPEDRVRQQHPYFITALRVLWVIVEKRGITFGSRLRSGLAFWRKFVEIPSRGNLILVKTNTFFCFLALRVFWWSHDVFFASI